MTQMQAIDDGHGGWLQVKSFDASHQGNCQLDFVPPHAPGIHFGGLA